MAIATATMKETLAGAYAGRATHASVHTATPGTTGASEHARAVITWSAGATDGVYTGTASLTVGSVTITHGGLWDAGSGGTFLDGGSLSASFAGPGSYTLTVTFTQS